MKNEKCDWIRKQSQRPVSFLPRNPLFCYFFRVNTGRRVCCSFTVDWNASYFFLFFFFIVACVIRCESHDLYGDPVTREITETGLAGAASLAPGVAWCFQSKNQLARWSLFNLSLHGALAGLAAEQCKEPTTTKRRRGQQLGVREAYRVFINSKCALPEYQSAFFYLISPVALRRMFLHGHFVY